MTNAYFIKSIRYNVGKRKLEKCIALLNISCLSRRPYKGGGDVGTWVT